MKYGLFERRWSPNLWALGLAEWTVAWMVKFRAVLHLGCRESGITTVDVAVCGRDYNFVLCCVVKFPACNFQTASCMRVRGICLRQWHTLDAHAKHYSKVIKGS